MSTTAAILGKVGLPAPLKEIAGRRWDVIEPATDYLSRVHRTRRSSWKIYGALASTIPKSPTRITFEPRSNYELNLMRVGVYSLNIRGRHVTRELIQAGESFFERTQSSRMCDAERHLPMASLIGRSTGSEMRQKAAAQEIRAAARGSLFRFSPSIGCPRKD